MKRPKQLPAVDRNSNKCVSVPVGANVGPSFWGIDYGDVRSLASWGYPPLANLIQKL
jgi:hypothetical protein